MRSVACCNCSRSVGVTSCCSSGRRNGFPQWLQWVASSGLPVPQSGQILVFLVSSLGLVDSQLFPDS